SQITAYSILPLIDNICTAVLGIARFSVAKRLGALLAKADGFDLAAVDTQQRHHATDSIRATLAQGQVVLCPATFVGIAFYADVLLRVFAEITGVGFNQVAILFGHGIAVKLKINRAILCQR